MKRWMLTCLVLGLGVAGTGCPAKDDKADEEKSSSDEDDDKKKKDKDKDKDEDEDGDDKKKKDKDEDDDDDKKDKDDEEEEDEDEDEEAAADEGGGSDVLDIKLPDENKQAPSLSGGTVASAAQVQWLSAGPLEVPNPGWKQINDPPATVLVAPDEKAAIVFAPFTSPQDGATKVDNVVKFLKLKQPRWNKAKQVSIGPNKVPALFGTGGATAPDGKPAKLFFALIRTGGPQNLLAIGLADADSPEATRRTGKNIIGSIRRK